MMAQKIWWTVVRIVDEAREEALTIVRKGKMSKTGITGLVKKHIHKHKTISKKTYKTTAFRHVLTDKRPKF